MDKKIYELSCNIDDMTGEELGFAMETILEAGALDVYTIPIYMKKNRPGVMLNVLCKTDELEKFKDLIFENTSSIGIRYREFDRFVLDREDINLNTIQGEVGLKKVTHKDNIRTKYNYADLVNLAKEQGITLMELKQKLNFPAI